MKSANVVQGAVEVLVRGASICPYEAVKKNYPQGNGRH